MQFANDAEYEGSSVSLLGTEYLWGNFEGFLDINPQEVFNGFEN